jgi:glycosyltransferase involved in cell wall biosynthesis
VKPPNKIPVSVIIVTRNEGPRIGGCLRGLKDFSEILVIDSSSTDGTPERAREEGVRVINFAWDGQYPKKRQWCLDNLRLEHERVFFVDADEEVTPELMDEIRALKWDCAGYFIKGRYVIGGRRLRFGLCNNKLALLDRRKIEFPVVDDLGLPGMGEIEGHYQPVLKSAFRNEKTGQLAVPLLHHAYEDETAWWERHRRYAAWERGMDRKKSWPSGMRRSKRFFRALPFRAAAAFAHCYIMKLGVFDGRAGLSFARSRYAYYRMARPDLLVRNGELPSDFF